MHLELPVLIGLLVAAIAVAVAAKRVDVPYNIALVVGGMLIALTGILPAAPRLEPELVFVVCLPLLLFEGGISAELRAIRVNAVPIALLAGLGMALSITATGAALAVLLRLPWSAGFLLGAVLSASDTVAVLYAFRRVAVPPRLSRLVEGESLFNDGTALVAYAALSRLVAGGDLSGVTMLSQAVGATVGGIGIGLALGFAAGFVLRWAEDPLTQIMTTTALSFAAYVAGEELGVSGAIAAVAAGLTIGAAIREQSSPSAEVAVSSFWDYVAFGVNTFLFLVVGLSTRPESLIEHLPETGMAVLAVFLGRAAGVYLPCLIIALIDRTQRIPLRWQNVFILGNIKGAISIALALGLPAETPERELLVDIAFGVTFISLVGQGLALGGVLRGLGLVESDPVAASIADQHARLLAARAARQELELLHTQGLVPKDGYEHLRSEYQVDIAAAERELRRLHERHLAHGAQLLIETRRRLIDAERTALLAARRAGVVPDAAADRMLEQIDERLIALSGSEEGR